jgi:nicotinate-nucleotide pyrophosphorylase (carboxylating)
MPDPISADPMQRPRPGAVPHDVLDRFWDDAVATGLVTRLIKLARDEDLGPRGIDRTAALLRTPNADTPIRSTALTFREPGIAAGLVAIPLVLDAFGAHQVAREIHRHDGELIQPGNRAATLHGPADQITTVERTILNIVGRLSGIATRAAMFVDAARVRSHTVQVLDTRKTTPGLRLLEKYAVRCGGGTSHRLGLHDAVLLKDNHLAAAAGNAASLTQWLTDAATAARADMTDPPAFVQVEVDTLDQLEAVLDVPAGLIDYVLLDNFSEAQLQTAVQRRDARASAIALEASGGVSIDTIGAIAATGVERISVGSLTHGARSLDVGLDDVSLEGDRDSD